MRRETVRSVVAALAVMFALAAVACRSATPPRTSQFIEDDYPSAIVAARETRRPLVVDVWASWCEPCKKMAVALRDPAVVAVRDRFVWLSVDEDVGKNRAFIRRYRHHSLPTIWIIDPTNDAVVLEWSYPVSGPTLERLLLASEKVVSRHPPAGKASARAWIEVLEREPLGTGEARSVLVQVLVDAYAVAGDPDRAVGYLEAREAEAPADFWFPMTLARVHSHRGRLDAARDASLRAVRLAPEERALEVLLLAGAIEAKRGDVDAEREVLKRAVEHAERSAAPDDRALAQAIRRRLVRLAGE